MTGDLLLVLGGLIALLLGGEALVRGAVALAHRAGLSPLVIGVTLVGFGTSTPELVTSVKAALDGLPGIAVGNVVGSNIANILLILGLSALIAPLSLADARGRDGWAMIAATVVCAGLVLTGVIGLWAGLALIAGLLIYLGIALKTGAVEADETAAALTPLVAAGFFVAGLIGIMLGAQALVSGAVAIAAELGVSEAVIGLTIVAVGTSLPELVTSVIAARKGQGALALGNVLGSNVFNVLGILGVTALVTPLSVPADIMGLTLWVLIGSAALVMALALSGIRASRVIGAGMVAAYVGYLAVLVLTSPGV